MKNRNSAFVGKKMKFGRFGTECFISKLLTYLDGITSLTYTLNHFGNMNLQLVHYSEY